MTISQLSLTDFRNLRSTTLEFSHTINLICGNNGAGKTSLLEAIYVLCQGCSFSTHQLKHCISHGKSGFLIFGRFSDYRAGLSRSEKKQEIKIDGVPAKRRSELVSKTPIGIANTASFELVMGPPQQRRAYLDWCLFHVEHQYSEHWVQFRHALKQRNQLLKQRQNLNLLDYWDEYLVKPSLLIRQQRERYVSLINQMLARHMEDTPADLKISLAYQCGWPEESSFMECLKANRDKDIKSGFTHYGVHRDNIVILSNGLSATQVLSRGQTKSLCLGLLITALKIVQEKGDRPIILLIDDLSSELDQSTQSRVFQQLFELDIQLFITNIENTVPPGFQGKEFKLFHVEHGIIKPLKSS